LLPTRRAFGVAVAVVGLRYVVVAVAMRVRSHSLLSRHVVLLSRSRRRAVWCCSRGGCRAAWCRIVVLTLHSLLQFYIKRFLEKQESSHACAITYTITCALMVIDTRESGASSKVFPNRFCVSLSSCAEQHIQIAYLEGPISDAS
jgi:hypothetical protein